MKLVECCDVKVKRDGALPGPHRHELAKAKLVASDPVSSVIEDVETGPHRLAQTKPSLCKCRPERRQLAGVQIHWRTRVLDYELGADNLAIYYDFNLHGPRP